ncbi:MAG: hypothetical protein AB2806_01635 [Candidatus Thiodiazotropha sp.]
MSAVGSAKQLEIDPRIIEQANLCQDCHRCISDPDFPICKIDYLAADGAVLFIFSDQCKNCGYRVSFGNSTICGCPVRREIMAKYGL